MDKLRNLIVKYQQKYPNCLPLYQKLLYPPEPVTRPGIETLCSKSFYEAYEMAINFLKGVQGFHWSKEKIWDLLTQLHEAAKKHEESTEEVTEVIARIRGVCFADGLKKSIEKNYQIVMNLEKVTHLNNPETMREDRLKALKETVKQLMKIEGMEADEEKEIDNVSQDELVGDGNAEKMSDKTEQEKSVTEVTTKEIENLEQLPRKVEKIVEKPVEKDLGSGLKREIISDPKETGIERVIKVEEPIKEGFEKEDLKKDSSEMDFINEDRENEAETREEIPVEQSRIDETRTDEHFNSSDTRDENFIEDQKHNEEMENELFRETDEEKEGLVDINPDKENEYVSEKVIQEGDSEEEEPLDSDIEEVSQAEEIDSDDRKVMIDTEGQISVEQNLDDDQEEPLDSESINSEQNLKPFPN